MRSLFSLRSLLILVFVLILGSIIIPPSVIQIIDVMKREGVYPLSAEQITGLVVVLFVCHLFAVFFLRPLLRLRQPTGTIAVTGAAAAAGGRAVLSNSAVATRTRDVTAFNINSITKIEQTRKKISDLINEQRPDLKRPHLAKEILFTKAIADDLSEDAFKTIVLDYAEEESSTWTHSSSDIQIHEAGHAVIAAKLGIPVASIRNNLGNGYTTIHAAYSLKTKKNLWNSVLMIAAGSLAENYFSDDFSAGSVDDHHKIYGYLNILHFVHHVGESTDALYEEAIKEATKLVHENIDLIVYVSKALLPMQTLTGNRFLELIEQYYTQQKTTL